MQSVKEKDEGLKSLMNHVQSLQNEVQQLSSLFHDHGRNKPLISDLVSLALAELLLDTRM